jgi:hypothetical protein
VERSCHEGDVQFLVACGKPAALLPAGQPVPYGAQSWGQLVFVSPPKQNPSPQRPQVPQSAPQPEQVSPGSSQVWSSLQLHWPQSFGQVTQFSSAEASQIPSPQPLQMPQSCGHVEHFSPLLHFPSPQCGL